MKSISKAFFLALPALWLCAAGLRAQDTAGEWNTAGVASLEAGRLDQALSQFGQAYRLDPEDGVIRLNLARAYGHRAKARMAAGRLPEAQADLQAGLEIERDRGSLEVLLAQTLLNTGKRGQASDVLARVCADFPDNLAAVRLSADILAVAGKVDQAVEMLRAAHERSPEDLPTKNRLNQLEQEQQAWNGFLTDSSAHFDYRYDPRRPAIVQAVPHLMNDLEDAFQAVYEGLGLAPVDRILVLILDRERYKGSAPAWSGGLYDGRIRLAVGDYASERASLRATLRHEYTHAALHRLGPPLPTWLHEGLAQWVELRPVDAARRRLRALPELPALDALAGDWTQWTDSDQVVAAYDYALSLCAWLREEYGVSGFSLLFDQIGRAGFEAGFRATFGKSVAEVDAEHRERLRLRE